MAKNSLFLFLILLFFYNFISCAKEPIVLELNQVRHGTLRDNEYDYYSLNLPDSFYKDSHLVVELEPNKELDLLNKIVSDPNIYMSLSEQNPDATKHTWKSQRFGDETIALSTLNVMPSQKFYISVYCKEKCNYILKTQLIKDNILRHNETNHFVLEPKSVTHYSFRTKFEFKELFVNVIGSFINSFKVYLAEDDPSSSNTLTPVPIIFNGYRFTIPKSVGLKNVNTNKKFKLVVDNDSEKQDLIIWLQYDNDNILIKEADILYDSINKDSAHCYYYRLDPYNRDEDIILSLSLFNGQGFVHMAGYNKVNADSISLNDKNKESNYIVVQSRAIHLTKSNYEKFGTFTENEKNSLNFCFYAEKDTSLSLKVYFLDNYKNLQALSVIYAGIGVEDIIPHNSIKKYKLEHFNIDKDILITLSGKTGDSKLYLIMESPEESEHILDWNTFQNLKKLNKVIEANLLYNSYNLILTKEQNKCKINKATGNYTCVLSAVVQCQSEINCNYNLVFDHLKTEVKMKPNELYTNVISQGEDDIYKIIIADPSVKNLVVVLMQNTGNCLIRLDNFKSDAGNIQLGEEVQNKTFLPNLIKVSKDQIKAANLKGTFTVEVKGLSYASYSIYYYTFNEEEKQEALDQDKVSMKLEKGRIIRDIFLDEHRFKIYMYDLSNTKNKTDLFVGLVEVDYMNLDFYIFKDLNDFSFSENNVKGYLWRGDSHDTLYIRKDDPKLQNLNILYIMVFKTRVYEVIGIGKKDSFTTFYLAITDENTPLVLNEGIEFSYDLDINHPSQNFYYYFIMNQNEEQDLQISLSLMYGCIKVRIKIDGNLYNSTYEIEDTTLITITKQEFLKYSSCVQNHGIEIEVTYDNSFYLSSSFIISVKSAKNTPIVLKQGIIQQRTILSGEDQHFIIDLKPDKSFGAKITAMFVNSLGEIFVRRLLRNELFKTNIFPDENNFEYMASYQDNKNGFYLIEIPYSDFGGHSHCRVMVTVRGIAPGNYQTKISYSISVSNPIFDIVTDKNYKLFISQGEIANFYFKVGTRPKRLYISMTNKDKDALMFLTNEPNVTNLEQYIWTSSGTYNEYIDLSIYDPYFVERGITELKGDYYLSIQGQEDTFYNLYISSQEVKFMALKEGYPSGCECETENDNCYFRYENLNYQFNKEINDKRIIFYTEYTYGRGEMSAKLYKDGDMKEILNSLPSKTNNDFFANEKNDFLIMRINQEDSHLANTNVIVVGVQCKQKSLFDISVVPLDTTTDVSRYAKNIIFLKLDQDNVYYLNFLTGITTKFIYYISKNRDLNFQIKALFGKARIHIYVNDTNEYFNVIGKRKKSMNTYYHIADFEIDSKIRNKGILSGRVPRLYGSDTMFHIEVKPLENCLFNMNINYDKVMYQLHLNKEVITEIKEYNYYAFYDFEASVNEVVVTVISFDDEAKYNVYLKTNVIPKEAVKKGEDDDDRYSYSKASYKNYDVKGSTNSLTSAVSLRIKNIQGSLKHKTDTARLLINVELVSYYHFKKIKIVVTPVVNDLVKINPLQNKYIFSSIEKRFVEKVVFNLKNNNEDNDLMIIELSSCKGHFLYTITDTPPLSTEQFSQLDKRKLEASEYSYNGKKIITVTDLEERDYYLTLYGLNSVNDRPLFIDEHRPKNFSHVDVLFYYYTTKKSNFNYLVTQDALNYERNDDNLSQKQKIEMY